MGLFQIPWGWRQRQICPEGFCYQLKFCSGRVRRWSLFVGKIYPWIFLNKFESLWFCLLSPGLILFVPSPEAAPHLPTPPQWKNTPRSSIPRDMKTWFLEILHKLNSFTAKGKFFFFPLVKVLSEFSQNTRYQEREKIPTLVGKQKAESKDVFCREEKAFFAPSPLREVFVSVAGWPGCFICWTPRSKLGDSLGSVWVHCGWAIQMSDGHSSPMSDGQGRKKIWQHHAGSHWTCTQIKSSCCAFEETTNS